MKQDNKTLTVYYILLGLCILGVVLTFAVSPLFGVAALAAVAVLIVITHGAFMAQAVQKGKESENTVDIGDLTVPENMPMPYAVLSKEGGILRYNQAFSELFDNAELGNTFFDAWMPEYQADVPVQRLQIGEGVYEIHSKTVSVTNDGKATGNEVTTLCFVDVTAISSLEQTIENQKTAIGLIYIDNYDEVVSGLVEIRLPLLTALVDKRISDRLAAFGGVLRKLEKDRYICLLTRKGLEEMMEGRFEILNEVKGVKVGDHIPMTLSLGFGVSNESLEGAMQDARSALDLALGRGGDQALVKENGKTLFFGGKSGEVAHNARVRARIKAEAFMELVAEADRVFVMGHKNPDLDSLGAALGVYRMASAAGKTCNIIIGNKNSSVQKLIDRLAEQEEYHNLFMSADAALAFLSDQTLTVVVDTHIPELTESPAMVEQCRRVVVLDHHRKSASFIDKAVLVYHEPYASSTCELVTEMIQYQGERVKLTKLEADALLGGMTVDTRSFSGKTGAITFETAAYLKRAGADSTRVRMLLQNDLEEYRAKARAVETTEFLKGQIAVAVCEPDSAGMATLAAQIANELLDVVGIKASFVLCPLADSVSVSARSLGEINVQTIMEKIGGGGHQTVAGGQFADRDLEEVKQMVIASAMEQIQED